MSIFQHKRSAGEAWEAIQMEFTAAHVCEYLYIYAYNYTSKQLLHQFLITFIKPTPNTGLKVTLNGNGFSIGAYIYIYKNAHIIHKIQ